MAHMIWAIYSLPLKLLLVLACKYSMDLEERARVCTNCRDKSVIGKTQQIACSWTVQIALWPVNIGASSSIGCSNWTIMSVLVCGTLFTILYCQYNISSNENNLFGLIMNTPYKSLTFIKCSILTFISLFCLHSKNLTSTNYKHKIIR